MTGSTYSTLGKTLSSPPLTQHFLCSRRCKGLLSCALYCPSRRRYKSSSHSGWRDPKRQNTIPGPSATMSARKTPQEGLQALKLRYHLILLLPVSCLRGEPRSKTLKPGPHLFGLFLDASGSEILTQHHSATQWGRPAYPKGTSMCYLALI